MERKWHDSKFGFPVSRYSRSFTLLVQDTEGGLEVQLPGSEKWQKVGHLPGAGSCFTF